MNQDIIISDKKDVELTDYERGVGKGEVEERRVSHPFCVGCVMLKILSSCRIVSSLSMKTNWFTH